MIYGSIICLGDSLTEGSRDERWRGYPIELELLLYSRHGQNWNCINAGVAGEISIEVYKRAYDVVRGYPEAAELVLLVGTNDAKMQVRTPPDRYSEHVEAILRIAQRFDKVSYLCTIPDLSGFGAPDFCDQEMIDEYNEYLQAIAAGWKISLVDLRELPDSCYADGVHMNNSGYKMIAEKVADAIERRRLYGVRRMVTKKTKILEG